MAIKVKNVEIIREIADREGIPFEDALLAVKSQFNTVSDRFKDHSCVTIRLPYFGKFFVDKNRYNKIYKDKSPWPTKSQPLSS